MTTETKHLRIALIVFGLFLTFGILPIAWLWPAGWAWNEHGIGSFYLQMIMAVYAVLGIFLMRAARDPHQHLSLIWFTVWSSVAHAAVMAVQSFMGHGQHSHLAHLIADVPALLIMAIVLGVLTRRSLTSEQEVNRGPAASASTPSD